MSVLYENIMPVFYISLKTLLKIFASISLVALILVPCVIFFEVRVSPKFSLISNSTNSTEKVKVKTILYWTGMFDEKTFRSKDNDLFRHCKISTCRATHDRNFMRIQEFDALLFHGIETKLSDLPSARSPRQKYIFIDLESTANDQLNFFNLPDKFYNWTMSYRRDSDIPLANGYIINFLTNKIEYPLWAKDENEVSYTVVRKIPEGRIWYNPALGFQAKRRTAASFLSDCDTIIGNRDRYIKELKIYTDVDVYGNCGNPFCESGNIKCYEMLEYRYYFYIAWENFLCDDFVTEKLYKIMSYNVVPIVYGAVLNYSKFAPPNSYININDFESPEQLAKHLNYLADNPEEYGKYFSWKKLFFIDFNQRSTFCKICEMLHNEKRFLPSSDIFDIKKWRSERKCQDTTKLVEKIIRK